MRSKGYGERFTLGLLTTSGSLGLLFPPSLPVILYGVVAQVDIGKHIQSGTGSGPSSHRLCFAPTPFSNSWASGRRERPQPFPSNR
jgi:TRAP-type C4-dicarboxylate transport system permease large subunit